MVYDILPERDLHYSDIRDTLAAGGGSVNNSVASAFKAAANINMWSKHKPVILNTNFCQDFDPNKPNYDADWWKGNGIDCGLDIPISDDYTELDKPITYKIPNGGSEQPFRIGDFAKYYAKAIPPYSISISDSPIIIGAQRTISIRKLEVPEENLTLEEAFRTNTPYLGVCVKHNGGTHYKAVRASGYDLYKIEIGQIPNLTEGQVTVYGFVCNGPIDDWTTAPTRALFSLGEYKVLNAIIPKETVYDINWRIPSPDNLAFSGSGVASVSAGKVNQRVNLRKQFSTFRFLEDVRGVAQIQPSGKILREITKTPSSCHAYPLEFGPDVLPPYSFTMTVDNFAEDAGDSAQVDISKGEYLTYTYYFTFS